jgi:aerobic C4-dicarboxylate transport protein
MDGPRGGTAISRARLIPAITATAATTVVTTTWSANSWRPTVQVRGLGNRDTTLVSAALAYVMNETVTWFSLAAILIAGCRVGSRRATTPRCYQGELMSTTLAPTGPPKKRDRTHYLYIAVIAAVVAGVAVGLLAPGFAVSLKPLGTAFVSLIKMMISPVIFCTIVLGVGSIRQAAKVGKVGGLALGYFVVMSTFALGIGLVVGNLLHPGAGLHLSDAAKKAGASAASTAHASGGTVDFLLGMIPDTLVSALTSGVVLQTLLVALLVGFAVQALGRSGEAVLGAVKHFERLVFRILSMIMWLAPVGAFGAIAAVVGATGWGALASLAQIMAGFYATCLIFVVVFLGLLLRLTTGVNIFSLLRYLAREFLLIVSTSSSESALPRLVAKMEHLGVSRPVVGITVPTGYSFNLDGTAIYLTMASLFIASALGTPLGIGEQISLLVFMVIASKGAAGVTGAGLATLAGGLQSHRPDLVDGVGLIVGIDRFMSEARAVTNFAGNAVATLIIGKWVGEFDRDQANRVFRGDDPFDEITMLDEDHAPAQAEPAADGKAAEHVPVREPVAA